MFRNVLIDLFLEFSWIWYMVEAVIFIVADVPVFIKGGECKVAAIMNKAFILREHTFIIVESCKK